MSGIEDIGAHMNVVDRVPADERARLSGKSVDTGGVTHTNGDMMNMIGHDAIVAYAICRFVPAPADTDASVGKFVDLVVFDGDFASVTDTDPDAAPILVGAIRDEIVGDAFASADFTRIGRVVRKMCFDSGIRKFPQLNSIAADITEDAALNGVIVRAVLKIQTGGREVFE